MLSKSLIALLPLIIPLSIAHAQQSGCAALPGFDAFDFWVGEWQVFDTETGDAVGENSIQKREQGCLLMENWSGNGGSSGVSLNYFNPVRDEWRQLWVSAGRYAIDIAGGLRDSVMVLEGSIYYFSGAEFDFRGSWTPHADGSVRQFFEQFNADSGSWEPWFDGRYVRKSD